MIRFRRTVLTELSAGIALSSDASFPVKFSWVFLFGGVYTGKEVRTVDDQELLEKLKRGDLDALEAVWVRYAGMMAYIVRGILPNPHETDECLAQIRVKLWEKLSSYQEEIASLPTYITAVCRNAAYDRLRQLRRQAERTAALTDETPDPAPSPEETLLRRERTERLKAALNALRDSDRRLFYRKYYYLQSTAQIAAELGLSERAVEGRLYRIRARLQKLLGGDAL